MSILMDGQALNITLCSHGNQLDFGILGCRNAMPDIELLADYVGEAFHELRTLAATRSPVASNEKIPSAKRIPRAASKPQAGAPQGAKASVAQPVPAPRRKRAAATTATVQ
jgi:hypothetical protein